MKVRRPRNHHLARRTSTADNVLEKKTWNKIDIILGYNFLNERKQAKINDTFFLNTVILIFESNTI